MVEPARELRDRSIEQINAAPHLMLPPSANGKYEVSRQLDAGVARSWGAAMKLDAALPEAALLEAA